MLEALFRTRWVSAIAVLGAVVGAVLMFIVGAGSTVHAVGVYFGAGEEEAFSSDAALETTIEMISALDQFLVALVLFVFAYGVLRLFMLRDRDDESFPDWFSIHSVTDLKVKLLETVAILIAVLFLKSVLAVPAGESIEWSALVLPVAVGVFAAATWLLSRTH